MTLGAFWMLEECATAVGRGYARQLAGSVDTLAHAVVIGPAPLLARSGGKVLLVHDGWTLRAGTVVVLADKEELSWEFSR